MSTPFDRARELFLAGVAQHQAGRFADAEASFTASLGLVPGRASTLSNLGAARVRLGRYEAALEALDGALEREPDDLEALSHRGLALAALGRAAEALACHDRVLAADARRLPNRIERALLLSTLQRPAEALEELDAVLAAQPGHAAAWFRRGEALQQLDRHDEALLSHDRALALEPTLAQAWSQRGGLLRDLGRRDEAAVCFEQAITNGGDADLNGYFLASVTGRSIPAAAPASYVGRLFDEYAETFEQHLVEGLNYQVPARLVECLRALGAARFGSALDLGCGTGLCGPLLRPLAERLAGLDLSANMLAKARTLGVYDELLQGELVEHLRTTSARHDLLLAADTFIYIGDLAPVFESARRAMASDALFAFSLERADAGVPEFELRPSLRYAHSEGYMRRLADQCGFGVREVRPAPIREEQGQPVEGLFVILQRGA